MLLFNKKVLFYDTCLAKKIQSTFFNKKSTLSAFLFFEASFNVLNEFKILHLFQKQFFMDGNQTSTALLK